MPTYPLGEFEQVVLLAILRQGRTAFGLEVREEIERCADRTVSRGAFYTTLDRLEKKDIAPHQYLSISSTVEGSFHSVSQFMYRLSGLPKIVSIDTVQMQPATQAPPDHVRCILQMTAYITKELQPKTMAAAVKLKEIAEAEEKYKAKHQTYGKLADLNSEGLLSLKEGETVEGYTFITDASTGKTTFKILAGTKEPNLHNLSMDQAKKIMDETDKVAYE